YRALKERYSFLELCSSPELTTEVTMQPIDILDVDAGIIFADILTPCSCLGFSVDFNPGPVVHNRIKNPEDISRISSKGIKDLPVLKALQTVSQILTNNFDTPKATIGFAGAPFTLACYLTDQKNYKHF